LPTLTGCRLSFADQPGRTTQPNLEIIERYSLSRHYNTSYLAPRGYPVRVKKPRLLSGISCLCTLAFLALALSADAQTTAGNELTWMGGCDRLNQSGVYGVQGVPTVANLPGGRSAALTWTDSKGNVLLFGGCGYTAAGVQDGLNDLWKFTPATGQWTWMSGSSSWGNIPTGGPAGVYGTLGTPSASNVHGARTGAVGWTDKNDNLWLGGEDSRRCCSRDDNCRACHQRSHVALGSVRQSLPLWS
jgi:hypothetical protein